MFLDIIQLCFFHHFIVVKVTFLNDSIIGHRHESDDAAQFTISLPEDGSESLCYGIYGSSNDFYNIISDTCTSVNIHFTQHPVRNDKNRISSIGIHAVTGDADTPCADIQIDLLGCRASINNSNITTSKNIGNMNVKKFSNGWKVFVPNCERPPAVMWITCVEDMLRFNVSRGSGLSPTSHGLLGKTISPELLEKFIWMRTSIIILLIIFILKSFHLIMI